MIPRIRNTTNKIVTISKTHLRVCTPWPPRGHVVWTECHANRCTRPRGEETGLLVGRARQSAHRSAHGAAGFAFLQLARHVLHAHVAPFGEQRVPSLVYEEI